MRIEMVGPEWRRRSELEQLLFDVLYRDFGVEFAGPWRHVGPEGTLAVALGEHERLLGTLRLLPASGDSERQLRQMAVAADARNAGVGRALVEELERVAADEGADAITLNARDTAFDFYRRLGYEFAGDTFVSELTRIPHRAMRKSIG